MKENLKTDSPEYTDHDYRKETENLVNHIQHCQLSENQGNYRGGVHMTRTFGLFHGVYLFTPFFCFFLEQFFSNKSFSKHQNLV